MLSREPVLLLLLLLLKMTMPSWLAGLVGGFALNDSVALDRELATTL